MKTLDHYAPEQSTNLQARAELMQQIAELIEAISLTQTEGAQHCSLTQPRINDILKGKLSKFHSMRYSILQATALGRR
jgi:predicted XRE-type DNA-binding protein